MERNIQTVYANSINEVIEIVLSISKTHELNPIYFRGETKDRIDGALSPSVYRSTYIEKEHIIYREMQRFNDNEFTTDKTAFDKLTRIQHYEAPTRMIDISEDLLSALYFAVENPKQDSNAIIYAIEMDYKKIKYYDSDAVSVVSNLAKLPLENNENAKSKRALIQDLRECGDDRDSFNEKESVGFLLHEIKEEKSYFSPIIEPKHLKSILCVKPKYTNSRIKGQKGAMLLFGLNTFDIYRPLSLFEAYGNIAIFNSSLSEELHPICNITKIVLSKDINKAQLSKLGITKPYIYPEMDKVSDYLKEIL